MNWSKQRSEARKNKDEKSLRAVEVEMMDTIDRELRSLGWKEDAVGFIFERENGGNVFVATSGGIGQSNCVRISIESKDFKGFFPRDLEHFWDRLQSTIKEESMGNITGF